MTLEEISTKIRDHLIAQNARSVSPITNHCKYRGDEDKMCAVGCLITDEVYDRTNGSIEGDCADATSVHNAVVESIGFQYTEDVEQVMLNWQAYHDDYVRVRFNKDTPTMSYTRWIETGDERESPEALHKLIMNGDLK